MSNFIARALNHFYVGCITTAFTNFIAKHLHERATGFGEARRHFAQRRNVVRFTRSNPDTKESHAACSFEGPRATLPISAQFYWENLAATADQEKCLYF